MLKLKQFYSFLFNLISSSLCTLKSYCTLNDITHLCRKAKRENQADPDANEAFSKTALLLEMSIHDRTRQPKVQGSKFSTES